MSEIVNCASRRAGGATEGRGAAPAARGVPFMESSRAHLGLSRMSYGYHFWHAIQNGLLLIYLGLTSLIHAVIPALFPGTAAKRVIRIFYEVIYEHPHPEFRALVRHYEARYGR